MRKLRASPTAHHIRKKHFANKFLYTCTHVFICINTMKRTLDCPYEGPYQILERIMDHIYKIDVQGQATNISTERLKLAFFEVTDDNEVHCPTIIRP